MADLDGSQEETGAEGTDSGSLARANDQTDRETKSNKRFRLCGNVSEVPQPVSHCLPTYADGKARWY